MNARVVEVVVRGRIGPELAFALEGFHVETDEAGLTRIRGLVTDQAQLLGLLDVLDDLNIEVVSMNPVGDGLSPPRDETG